VRIHRHDAIQENRLGEKISERAPEPGKLDVEGDCVCETIDPTSRDEQLQVKGLASAVMEKRRLN
jgi:hypothetical protein